MPYGSQLKVISYSDNVCFVFFLLLGHCNNRPRSYNIFICTEKNVCAICLEHCEIAFIHIHCGRNTHTHTSIHIYSNTHMLKAYKTQIRQSLNYFIFDYSMRIPYFVVLLLFFYFSPFNVIVVLSFFSAYFLQIHSLCTYARQSALRYASN